MIEISHLTKKFDQFVAVDDLSFSVREGEVLGFLGPNGAGKSTTMKVITGFLAPSAGKVTIDGHDISSAALQAKRLIGYLPEGAPSYGDMTTLEFLRFIAQIRGFRGAEIEQRVDHVINEVALESVRDQSIETLSKGFKRRVGLAQAIMHDPKVLILDEPTDGLDPNQKHHVRALIKSLATDKIVIVSTHILEEVTAVCSRAVIIANGKIVADGTPAELESQSRFHQAIRVTLTDSHDLLADLKAVPGVASVEVAESNGLAYTIFAEGGASIFSQVSEVAQQKHWPISEFHVERGQLEDVFRSVTQQSEGRANG
ncbi:MAG: ABC transporter ATP-binding protein [Pseudohongiellaceae bacterium]|jgi:ABC-2 type transport system ATP-binding protein|nr:ATP-binding cassette domain-containing protein [Pseudomonadota bacterium]NBQ73289.1 ATP-binding cassette domain-containing protein [Gammaproteobacteria bacterium]|tara:strand:+ start:332 stop:1273 length:942 start_codon:yes stop_codon:yes gene_type:complete